MMKKLFILTAIITGFSFMSVDGNCTSGIYDTQYKQQQYLNTQFDNIENEVPDYNKYVINKELSEVEKLSKEIKEFTEEYDNDIKDQIQRKVSNIIQKYESGIAELNGQEQYHGLIVNNDNVNTFSEYYDIEQAIKKEKDEQLDYLKTKLQLIKEEYYNNIAELNEQYSDRIVDINKDIKIFDEYVDREQKIIRNRNMQLIDLLYIDEN